MATVAARSPVPDVASALLDFLQERLGVPDLAYAEPPALIPDGWEAQVYRFRLESRRDLPPAFARPLIVRAYGNQVALPRLQREFDIQLDLADRDYPVARPLLMDENAAGFGGPFMVMEWIPGQTLFEVLLHYFPGIWWAPGEMARLHARLHRLPAGPFSWPAEPLLARSLAALEAMVQEYRLYGLAAGLDWLEDHQVPPPAKVSLLHLDFHPINLMFHGRDCTAVLDWSEVDVGDRHADIAATLVLIRSAPVELKKPRHRIATAIGKLFMERWYVQAYQQLLPIDPDKLTYYLAWAAFRRLCRYGSWLRASPAVSAYKPVSIRLARPDRIWFLCRSFRKRTGVAVQLP
jgi:aminoglycoside phosphotransferase (APT) family kinase protein